MMTTPQTLTDVMSWLEPMTQTDKYEIASRIALAGLDGYKGTLTAEQQRRLFGRYIFGKMTMTISCLSNGRVHGFRKIAFGLDWEDFDLTFDDIAKISNDPKSFSIAGRTTTRK